MCSVQTKGWKIACGALLHTTYNENGLWRFIHNTYNIQCVTNQKNVLLVLLNGMWERRWNCMDTTNLTFTIGASNLNLLQSRIKALWLLSRPNMWVQIKSTMDQRWVNNGSTMHHRFHTMCHMYKNCTTCSARWNVRTGMKRYGHAKFDIQK